METLAPRLTNEVAAMVANQIARVRLMPGMERARAIIIVESNIAMLADGTYFHLEALGVPNMLLLHLNHYYASGLKRRVDGTPANNAGEMTPGLWTSASNKPIMMEELACFFTEARLLRHARVVTYATRNTEREEELLHAANGDEATLVATHRDALIDAELAHRGEGSGRVVDTVAVLRLGGMHAAHTGPVSAGSERTAGAAVPAGATAGTLDAVFVAESRVRLIATLAQQCKNMKRYTTFRKKRAGTSAPGADDTRTIVTYCGKERATANKPEGKDDLVMSMGMIIMGARAFYCDPAFATERQRARVFAAAAPASRDF